MQLTVKELARKLEAISPEPHETLIRQIRNWTDMGFLGVIGALNTGTGRNRLYSQESACVAALAIELARWGVRPSISRTVCLGVYAMLHLPEENIAKQIYHGSDDYLMAIHSPEGESSASIAWIKRSTSLGGKASSGAESTEREFYSMIIIDLPDLWSKLA